MAIHDWIMLTFIFLQALGLSLAFLHQYSMPDTDALDWKVNVSQSLAKATGPIIHIDLALLLLPLSRSVIWILKIIFGHGMDLRYTAQAHRLFAWSIAALAVLHAVSYWLFMIAVGTDKGWEISRLLRIGFASGVGWTGHTILLIFACNLIMTLLAGRIHWLRRQLNCGSAFWIAIFMLWAVHEAYRPACAVSPERCLSNYAFWPYWVTGATLLLVEKLLLALKAKHTVCDKCQLTYVPLMVDKTSITKVIQNPNQVLEIQMDKQGFISKAAQRVLFSCPSVSLNEVRSLTITSAPEDAYLSVHIRCKDSFTQSLADRLGCSTGRKTLRGAVDLSTFVGIDIEHSENDFTSDARRNLPLVMLQSPSEITKDKIFFYDVVVLIGAEEGVMPFASILKSVWYRMNCPHAALGLQKVYFLWVCHDFQSYEWFRSILLAIEFQDMDSHIEVYTYLTAPFDEADATKNLINSAVNGADVITGFKTTTQLGPPHWDEIFEDVRRIHGPMVEVGVFYDGSRGLGKEIRQGCAGDRGFVWNGNDF